ncbi:MAG: KGG domain-containing protein [Pseudomonadota bacterium]|nr:KGG domain-containing protein [Pseudomonadota bacterium]
MARQETRSGTSNRGFASMDPELQRAIASKGGKAAHQSGNAHRFTSEEAREAGRKGGQAAHRRSAASQNRTARDEVDFEKESKAASDDDMEVEDESYEGNDQSLQTSAKDTDHSRQGGYPDAQNEARGHGNSRGLPDTHARMRDYQAENQGRNQGRNNFSTDQERAARSGQGRDR